MDENKMYKAKIISTEGLEYSWMSRHKEGDIIEIADNFAYGWRKNLKLLEHFKIITKSKKRCKCCGNWIIKRERKALD